MWGGLLCIIHLYYSTNTRAPLAAGRMGRGRRAALGAKRLALRLGGFGVSADRSCDPAQLGGERLSSLQSEVAASCFISAEWCTCLPRQVLLVSLRGACAALQERVSVVVYLSPVFACRWVCSRRCLLAAASCSKGSSVACACAFLSLPSYSLTAPPLQSSRSRVSV